MRGPGQAGRAGPGSRPHVVVIGGGLAGISAALACADAGVRVTLVEKRARLGGLTWSFTHDGVHIDNGQHVFLRCCTAYLDFLGRIGSAGDVELQDRLDVTVLRPRAIHPGGHEPGAGVDRARLSRDRPEPPSTWPGRSCASASSRPPTGPASAPPPWPWPGSTSTTPPWTSRPSGTGCRPTGKVRPPFRRCGTLSACLRSTCRLERRRWPWPPRSSRPAC